jgi:precorrin-6Y C5,15-methyltransferase (decarboxylating)
MGDFLEVDCDALPREKPANPWVMNSFPDAIFIGGHNGQLKEIMAKACSYLSPTGIIVMNSVKAPKVLTDSHQLWDAACQELRLHQAPPIRIVIDEHHPIEILRCKR